MAKFLWTFVLLGFVSLGLTQVELVGPLAREEILAALPEWENLAEAYAPNNETVARLRTIQKKVEIEVVLGTWCPDSRQHVSSFFKILDVVGNSALEASYIGVPRSRAAWSQHAPGRNAERVPTFIIRLDGQEIGRIIETPRLSIEDDLWEIIAKASGDL